MADPEGVTAAVPIRPNVARMTDPRAQQLLEFCGHVLIDSMADGELPAGVVLVVLGREGGVTVTCDVEKPWRIPDGFAIAASVCQDKTIEALKQGASLGLEPPAS